MFFPFQELFCLAVAFLMGAAAMLAASCLVWRISAWIDKCCRRNKRREEIKEKMEHLCQGPMCHVRPLEMAWDQGDLTRRNDDILIQPSPVGSALLIRRVSSALAMTRKAEEDMNLPVGEGAKLLQGGPDGGDLPAPP